MNHQLTNGVQDVEEDEEVPDDCDVSQLADDIRCITRISHNVAVSRGRADYPHHTRVNRLESILSVSNERER